MPWRRVLLRALKCSLVLLLGAVCWQGCFYSLDGSLVGKQRDAGDAFLDSGGDRGPAGDRGAGDAAPDQAVDGAAGP